MASAAGYRCSDPEHAHRKNHCAQEDWKRRCASLKRRTTWWRLIAGCIESQVDMDEVRDQECPDCSDESVRD